MSPSLDQDGWELESAVARHESHPDTFELPSDEDLRALEVGDQAKLLFWFHDEDDAGKTFGVCERKWVEVESHDGQALIGRLVTDPAATQAPLRAGDLIAFERHHVCDLLSKAVQHYLAALPPDDAMAAWEAAQRNSVNETPRQGEEP